MHIHLYLSVQGSFQQSRVYWKLFQWVCCQLPYTLVPIYWELLQTLNMTYTSGQLHAGVWVLFHSSMCPPVDRALHQVARCLHGSAAVQTGWNGSWCQVVWKLGLMWCHQLQRHHSHANVGLGFAKQEHLHWTEKQNTLYDNYITTKQAIFLTKYLKSCFHGICHALMTEVIGCCAFLEAT